MRPGEGEEAEGEEMRMTPEQYEDVAADLLEDAAAMSSCVYSAPPDLLVEMGKLMVAKDTRIKADLTAALENRPTAKEFEDVCTANHSLEKELAAAQASLQQWACRFECMEMAGAEQARRADQNAADLAAAKADVERLKDYANTLANYKADNERLRALCAARPKVVGEWGYPTTDEVHAWYAEIDAAGRGEGKA